ncbi:MAG TPA: hypothetical protein VFP19_00035, partial [Candidatus Limnocylindrales bacterium]|nr:hypothetical protein [Candidatus Limnocylindrales bacterium]
MPSLDPARVIRSQVVLEEHDVSADGRYAVIVRRFVAGKRYRSHLWLVPLAEPGRPRRLTSGPVRDTRPRLSPDGRAVAFKRTDEPPRGRAGSRSSTGKRRAHTPATPRDRVLVLPLADGRPGRPFAIRTPRDRAVSELAWSPDGRRLALAMQAEEERFLVGRRPAPEADEAPLARRITRIDWRYDESGHLDHWDHLFVVDARPGATPVQLTDGDWGVADVAWSPAGDQIAFTADPRPEADLRPRRSIWAVAVPAPGAAPARRLGQPREVLALGGDTYAPAWSPDGRWLSAVGFVPPDPLDDESPTLVVGPAGGGAPPQVIAPELDRPFGAWIDTDLFGWTAPSRTTPAWAGPTTIVAVVGDRGQALPWRFEIDPMTGGAVGRPGPMLAGEVATHSLAVAALSEVPKDRRVTVLACLGSRPLELVVVPLREAPGGSTTTPTQPPVPRPRTSLG